MRGKPTAQSSTFHSSYVSKNKKSLPFPNARHFNSEKNIYLMPNIVKSKINL